MNSRLAPLVALGLLCAAHPLSALYIRPEIRQVPVARLASNLERDLTSGPADAARHITLARLYGMAYAMNADEVPVATFKPGGPEQIWFGHEPNLIPHRVEPDPATPRREASLGYLAKATGHYRAALQLEPGNLLAQLGHAWTLEQAGDRPAAIAGYREVVETAWPKESQVRGVNLGQRFFTAEAAGYLIPLLDPERDAAEVAELRRRIDLFEQMPRPITPLAIPLSDGASLASLLDPDAHVPFDADGSGLRHHWTWISPAAGWLVYDPAGTGTITSALQWFGNVTFWLFWDNGYDALCALDDDADGELAGSELRYLAIWHDVNSNGVSEPGEVRSLDAHGIVSLSCRFTEGDGVLLAASSERGVRFSDGSVRPTYDVVLRGSGIGDRGSGIGAGIGDRGGDRQSPSETVNPVCRSMSSRNECQTEQYLSRDS